MCPADDEFSGALGSFSQRQLNTYMQFTEAREMLNELKSSWRLPRQKYETAEPALWHRPM